MWIGGEEIAPNLEWLEWLVSEEDRRYTNGVSPGTYREGEDVAQPSIHGLLEPLGEGFGSRKGWCG